MARTSTPANGPGAWPLVIARFEAQHLPRRRPTRCARLTDQLRFAAPVLSFDDALGAGLDHHRAPAQEAQKSHPAAISAAREEDAETAASTGMLAIMAFWVNSKLARPDTVRTVPRSGNWSSLSAQSMTLSTAL